MSENNEYIIEIIEKKSLEIKKYIDKSFEEQDKNNKIFFNNILEIVKLNVNEENEKNNQKLKDLIKKLEDTTNTNDVLCKKIIEEIKNIDSIYEIINIDDKDDKNKKSLILYNDIVKGVKQFSLQLVITISLILIVLGSFQLINLIF